MPHQTPLPKTKRRRAAWIYAAAFAVLAVALLACEHDHYWRGSEPWSSAEVRRFSDPDAAHAELVRRMAPPAAKGGTEEEVLAHSAGCITCHGQTDEPDMHAGRTLAIGCTDCHGGDAAVKSTLDKPGRPGEPGTPIIDAPYLAAMGKAHVQPRNPQAWYSRDDLATGEKPRAFGTHAHADPTLMHGSRNPATSYASLNSESPEFVRFINPGDLRAAEFACGACHAKEVAANQHSMMAHGAMLWGAALYNNGSIPNKIPRFGESYSAFGIPQRLQGSIDLSKVTWDEKNKRIIAPIQYPSLAETLAKGVLPSLEPLPTWNISQPGNILRVFERGGRLPNPELALPNPNVEGGKPDKGLSPRGLGTLNRTDPVFLGIQKTRLLDPILPLLGTNDHAGDYRSSGCTACHTPYANDRDPAHSASLAKFGNRGTSASVDPTISKTEPGHPIKHAFTTAIPNSQCITCHIHPGTSYANAYLGYMWWDNESDGQFMYPESSRKPTPEQEWAALRKNPEAAQLRGLWGDLYPDAKSHAGELSLRDFLERTGKPRAGTIDPLERAKAANDPSFKPAATVNDAPVLNDKLQHNQFADFHGHGWMFRAVFKKDRQGSLLTLNDEVIPAGDPDKFAKAVHLKDIHLEKGMHCVDCHFTQDVHGDGKLYGETRNAIEITCVDCHGSYAQKSNLRTSGPAAPPGGTDMSRMTIGPRRQKRFEWVDGKLMQRSSIDPAVQWQVVQTLDTINPESDWAKSHPQSAEKSRYAKTVRKDGKTWGDLPTPENKGAVAGDADYARAANALAHSEGTMECYTCHTSWMTSCFGCHLPMKANQRTPMQHNENLYTRNFTQYNFQVLRDDVFMLGRDGSVKGGKIVPVRSSSAVVVSSQNQNREWIYHQQQTVSGEGYSGQAFNPHFPHATSGAGTTKTCSDCHLAADGSNNAWMAQVLLQGTNFVSFFGRYVYVAEGGHGLRAVAVTEHDEPQAVYGSGLHALAFPDEHKTFIEKGRRLGESYHHGAGLGNEILDLQVRGEYLYAARGKGGFYVYDIANIDNKGFSERIVTAPVSPLGQNLGFDTKYAVAIASPSTLAVDPARQRFSADASKPYANVLQDAQPWHVNQEQRVHPLYAYLYIGDRDEGLILTNAATLLDGDPTNNFMKRAKLNDGKTAFNPDGILDGLTHLVVAGHYVLATAKAGLVVIDIDQPTSPKVVATVTGLRDPQAVAVQFRYAFVTDADGLKVVDITQMTAPRLVVGAAVKIPGKAHRLYVARTHAFVAAGEAGLAIVDVTNPEKPALERVFNADGKLGDTRDVKVGMTNASLFAYVADGKNGLAVLQLMGPETTAQFRGFSPPLDPKLIAAFATDGPALAVSKGLDRDRAVDETGNQVAVFGRVGARPMNLAEMQRMYLRDGKPWFVTDRPEGAPREFKATSPAAEQPAPQAPPAAPANRPGPRRPGPQR